MSAPAEAAAMSWPSLPCPSWCSSRHEQDRSAQHHMTDRPIGDFDTGWVCLIMVDYGSYYPALESEKGEMHIHVSWRYPSADGGTRTVTRTLAEAEQFAETATALGRDDVAELIGELAALARAGDLSAGSLPSVYSSPDLSRG